MSMNALASTPFSPASSSFQEHDKKPPAQIGYSHRSANNCSKEKEEELVEDLLIVFQAAPLVWFSEDGTAHSIKSMDFEFEQEMLSKTLREACSAQFNIRVEYEIATTDRLGLVLAQAKGRVLHFSCHGHPTYLALEADGWGGLTMLDFSRLQAWISEGGKNLQFVFVSACNSALIGDAFVRAGVPHVLCCRIDSMLREDTAVEFEKSFYRNLACGRTLQSAFDMARHQILNSPHIHPEDRQNEIDKFCLLPLGANHDVQVFFQPPLPPTPRPKRYIPPTLFPLPPTTFIGRESDKYQVLQALKRGSRLVRVSGDRGVGKSALVKSCCRYLNERLHVVDLDEILWIPYHRNRNEMPFSVFEKVLDTIREHRESPDERSPTTPFLGKARQFIAKLVEYFDARKTLLVIEATHFASGRDISRLCEFIEELLRKTRYVKIIVIHQTDFEITTNQSFGAEESIFLDPLDFHSSLTLFEHLCPHRHLSPLPPHLCKLLEMQVGLLPFSNPPRMSKRLSNVFDMIGNGIPTQIHKKANRMDSFEYKTLVSLVQQDDCDTVCCSRAEVLVKQKVVSDEISMAAASGNYAKAHELQILFDDLEAQKEAFPDIADLQRQFDEATYRLQLAVSSKNWAEAHSRRRELDSLDTAIKMESDVEATIDEHDAQVLQTRASLEAKLLQLEEDLKTSLASDKYDRAREIKVELKRLKKARSQKPSRADYAVKVNALKWELGNAKAEQNVDVAEMIYIRLAELEAQLKIEEEAEVALDIRVPATHDQQEDTTSTLSLLRPASARAESQRSTDSDAKTSAASTQSADPPGLPPVQFREERLENPSRKQGRENEKAGASGESRRPIVQRPAGLDGQTSPLGGRPIVGGPSGGDSDVSPGATRVLGECTGDEVDNLFVASDMATNQDLATDVAPAEEAVGALESSLGGFVVTAEVVQEQLSLEQAILETLRKNMVEAVDITLEEKERKGFGKFFSKWGKKLKR
mmetsp:Transcript_103878/g.155542  ORF Transcript_103878/g.155542 Transcript_103878/m.155542 type:complete len:984 (-) Transcript_103878:345-3296(-)|eukprot:CAMPEP_0117057474 /NCGR_PEP_ID=MMETSP0472-20121206/39910_1 /TAXON_ID=693140 ORGANISM="Tiarina fusus, Strain LIS" /NCGR_SAMPLE_ID=MMETSP0472 /ASSEMBLY_ACC=CAM_ASM_000603 /LENGTH=983 /DNA_ID=CAMNT_0004774391 /DNA_START=159 /DNA_END=3110 /DNA_ORIENTATION=-